MKLEHLAIWVDDIELMKRFYLNYFDVTCGEIYRNISKKYTSYFISFNEGGSRIELMHRPDIIENTEKRGFTKGLAHLAISVGSRSAVDNLTIRLKEDGYEIVGQPRQSGDGYYESAVLDPEGNLIEIIA